MYSHPRYARKSHRHPSAGFRRSYIPRPQYSRKPASHRNKRQRYSNYTEPSSGVYIEEPESEPEASSESEYDAYGSDLAEETYDFPLEINEDEDDEDSGIEEIFVLPEDDEDDYSDSDIVDLNDDLTEQALDFMTEDGVVRDVNDDLVRFYDSDSEVASEDEEIDSDEYTLDSEDEDILLITQPDSEDESVTDLEMDYESESEIEDVRQQFASELDSSDEEPLSDSEDELDAEDIFFDVNSEYSSSDDEDEADEQKLLTNYDDMEDESSDEDGVTIYRHGYPLYSSDDEYNEEELDEDDQGLLMAQDSDEEFDVIDLSKDLKNSKDCEVIDLDENTYKLNLRLPAIIKDDVKINFLKKENELVISGKFDFTGEESDAEIDDEVAEDAGQENDEEEEENDEDYKEEEAKEDEDASSSSDSSLSESESESESESDSESSSSSSSSSSSEDESSDSEVDDEEEVLEDAEDMIKDFKNQEIQFEKHFQFEKIVKPDQIKATFLPNGELEVIIPNEGVPQETNENIVSISLGGLEEARPEDQSNVENIEAQEEPQPQEKEKEDVEMEA